MMGPISVRVPVRILFSPQTTIEILLRAFETQLSAMIGFEHCALKALSNQGDIKTMPQQAVFNWNPPGSDVSAKRIICHDKEVAPAVLAYREDLSIPYAHDYGVMFEVHEHDGHIAIQTNYDPALILDDQMKRLIWDFSTHLTCIIKKKGRTVAELLAATKAIQTGRVVEE